MEKILDYLKYPSTYKGIITILGIVGVQLSPEQSEAIITAAVALYGAISLFFSDADVNKK